MHLINMKKIISLLVFIYSLANTVFAQTDLKKWVIAYGKVEIMVPENYTINSDEKTGIFAFSQDAIKSPGSILSFSLGDENISDNEIPAFTDDRLKLAKLNDDSFRYIDDGIHLQDGKNIGYIKFSTKEGKTKYFHYTFFISVYAKPLLFKFSCPFKQRKRWEAAVDNMANSLMIIQ